MPPFLQFRMWMREGPPVERVLAGAAALLALVLVAIALVPIEHDHPSGDIGAAGSVAANGSSEAGAPGSGDGSVRPRQEGAQQPAAAGTAAQPGGSTTVGGPAAGSRATGAPAGASS